jgi:hypothetical protein
MRKICIALAFGITLASSLQADELKEDKTARIVKLLPDLESPLNVELFIPEDYKLVFRLSEPSDAYFLGPENLEDNFIDKITSVNQPVIQVIKQSGFKSFEKDMKELVSQMKAHFPCSFEGTFSKWGNYPVAVIQMKPDLDVVYVAYVGLNDDPGNVLVFRLVYPMTNEYGNGNMPRQEDLDFWKNFLEKTKPL